MLHDVFISYAREDRAFADELIDRLRRAGVEVWSDVVIPPGTDWRRDIDEAITGACVLVLVLSSHAKASEYVTYEWAYALGAGKQVVPVLLEPLALHPRLEALQYVDFSAVSESAWQRLVGRIDAVLGEDPLRLIRRLGSFSAPITYLLRSSQDRIRDHGTNRVQSDTFNRQGREQVREFGRGGGYADGQAWHSLGHAVEDYADAIRWDPTFEHAWINLAYVYHVTGSGMLAAECMQIASRLAGPGRHYREVDEAIKQNRYLTGGTVQPLVMPSWFREKYRQYFGTGGV